MSFVPRGTSLSSRRGALCGAILIGGESRRMGRAKHLLDWRGETFVERAVRLLDAIVPELALVGAGELPASLGSRRRLRDAPGLHGPIAGIVAALEERCGEAVLVIACDQPLLSEELLRWLVAQRAPGVVAVQPRVASDRIEPFPAIYEPEALAPLRRLGSLAGAAASLQRLAALAPVSTPAVPPEFAPALRGGNTPRELAELTALAGPHPAAGDGSGA